jgi:hypothetical protein
VTAGQGTDRELTAFYLLQQAAEPDCATLLVAPA